MIVHKNKQSEGRQFESGREHPFFAIFPAASDVMNGNETLSFWASGVPGGMHFVLLWKSALDHILRMLVLTQLPLTLQCFFASFALCFSAMSPPNLQKAVTPSTKLLPTHFHHVASAELKPCLFIFLAMINASVIWMASMMGRTINLTCSTNREKAGSINRRLSYSRLPGRKFAPLGSRR